MVHIEYSVMVANAILVGMIGPTSLEYQTACIRYTAKTELYALLDRTCFNILMVQIE